MPPERSFDEPTAPRVRKLGSRVCVANVLPLAPDGSLITGSDIQQQTHAAFRGLRDALQRAGVELADLVRLNTCYVYKGPEDDATRYWEKMTEVRLQYFPDPGPVGTAVRVAGTGFDGVLIQLEAEALLPQLRADRIRLMPDDRWDWSVPLPLSQGWRRDDHVWVGGQISADKRGRTVHAGDLQAQTAAVMRHIGSVLGAAGAGFGDLLHLKVCYLHDGDVAAAEARLADIMKVVRKACGGSLPAVTAFGVNLLYEGLLLEIDAFAALGDGAVQTVTAADNANWAAAHAGARRGPYCQASGHSARLPASASLEDKVGASLRQCIDALKAMGAAPENAARMTVLLSDPACKRAGMSDVSTVMRIVESGWPAATPPALSVVRTEGLPDGADVQIDAFAMLGEQVEAVRAARG